MDIFLSKEEHDALLLQQEGSDDDDSSVSSNSSSSSSGSDSNSTSSSPKKVKSTVPTRSDSSNKPKKKPFWSAKPIIYMKGLPFSATIEEIRNMFCDCGEIASITRQMNESQRWTGAVTIRFRDATAMNHALKLDRTVWSGTGGDGVRYVRISEHDAKAKKSIPKPDNLCNIYVGNLPKSVTEEQIRCAMQRCGGIKSIRIAKSTTGGCKGFAHVEFTTRGGRAEALTLNGKAKLLPEETKYLVVRAATAGGDGKKRTERKKKNKSDARSTQENGETVSKSVGEKRKRETNK